MHKFLGGALREKLIMPCIAYMLENGIIALPFDGRFSLLNRCFRCSWKKGHFRLRYFKRAQLHCRAWHSDCPGLAADFPNLPQHCSGLCMHPSTHLPHDCMLMMHDDHAC